LLHEGSIDEVNINVDVGLLVAIITQQSLLSAGFAILTKQH